MFQAAARIRSQMQDERVVVIGNAAEHRGLGFDNFLHVGAHALGIIVAVAVDHDPMRHAAHLKSRVL